MTENDPGLRIGSFDKNANETIKDFADFHPHVNTYNILYNYERDSFKMVAG